MSEKIVCPICGNESSKEEGHYCGESFVCNKCGRIEIEHQVVTEIIENLKLKSCLYFYFTHMAKNRVKYFITNNKGFKSETKKVIYTEEIINIYPDNISKKIDMVLLNLSKMNKEIGNSFIFPLTKGNYEHILFISIHDKSEHIRANILEFLENMEYIKSGKILNGEGVFCTIDYKGWKRIDEVSKKYKYYKKAFIAMSFKEELNPIREKIKEAIIDTGYIHSIIDEKEHNEFIVPEIIHEIETSDFVVADLTGNRGGVYFEAGYAMALGKTLILTVDERLENEEPHFDVAQINQVRYKDEEDLKKKLIRRIEATVGKAI